MQGANGEMSKGIIPRMTSAVFDKIDREKEQNPSMHFLVTASYFELYNEIIFVSNLHYIDLLSFFNVL